MSYPVQRLRRLRQNASIRRLVRETSLSPADFICPLFVSSRPDLNEPLAAMPGVALLSGLPLEAAAREIAAADIPAVLLFAVLEDHEKDPGATLACSPVGPVHQAIARIKSAAPDLAVIADLCLCEYTLDCHCGIYRHGALDNDATLEVLARAAVSLAGAGADVIAPSGMMDGATAALRRALDREGFQRVLTMPYSAKYASALYGPFKSATRSAPAGSLHATHQLDPANARQAMEEIRLDVEEGADLVIVKPALAYLDILAAARRRFDVPIAAYQVSGEYNMILHAAGGDPILLERLMLEMLGCIKRAGADMIITYFALPAARALSA